MAVYPKLPQFIYLKEDLYNTLSDWGNQLINQLQLRDDEVNSQPSTQILTVVTVGNIGRPSNGNVAYSLSASKFRGYVSGTGWVDFN